jgi:hypothetical protein
MRSIFDTSQGALFFPLHYNAFSFCFGFDLPSQRHLCLFASSFAISRPRTLGEAPGSGLRGSEIPKLTLLMHVAAPLVSDCARLLYC